MISTPSTLICGPDSQWQGTAPVCTQVFCEPPDVPNGAATTTGPYPHQTIVEVCIAAGTGIIL